jgi:soluble P-type ATPase
MYPILKEDKTIEIKVKIASKETLGKLDSLYEKRRTEIDSLDEGIEKIIFRDITNKLNNPGSLI